MIPDARESLMEEEELRWEQGVGQKEVPAQDPHIEGKWAIPSRISIF